MTSALLPVGAVLAGGWSEALSVEAVAGRMRLLANVDDILLWADEIGGCRTYRDRLRALARVRDLHDNASLDCFLATGHWPPPSEKRHGVRRGHHVEGPPVPGDTRLLLTTREVAKRLSVDHAVVRGLILAGSLPVVLIGQAERIPANLLDDLVESLTANAPTTPAPATQETSSAGTSGLMTPQEVSDYLGVPINTLYTWRYARKGPVAVRVGRHLRWRRAEVESWLNRESRDLRR